MHPTLSAVSSTCVYQSYPDHPEEPGDRGLEVGGRRRARRVAVLDEEGDEQRGEDADHGHLDERADVRAPLPSPEPAPARPPLPPRPPHAPHPPPRPPPRPP